MSATGQRAQACAAIAASALPLSGAAGDYDALLDLVGEARFVLLGEATHGRHEFYAERARITRRLIAEKGFNAVAVEADWPDAYRVHCHVRGFDHGPADGAAAVASLGGFQRFPSWMWRNTDVVRFVEWLRYHNDAQAAPERAGFYGLDLYSLFTSIDEVLRYLDRVDPAAAAAARQRYACFDHFGKDSQRYAYAAGFGISASCEAGVIEQLLALQSRAGAYLEREDAGPAEAADAYFYAQQNARLVMNAERYYRTMFQGRTASWNLRDSHMADTLDALADHLGTPARPAKIVVWAHNAHVGDARATESNRVGEFNIGQLVRERHGREAFLVGFSTYDGWVAAASRWDGLPEHKAVRPALPDSYEALCHQAGPGRFLLPLTVGNAASQALATERLQRAIGVLYLPRSERQSHYFFARLAAQFDALIHIDHTHAVHPLDSVGQGPGGEVPETFPVGL